jgi:hypothetical protein
VTKTSDAQLRAQAKYQSSPEQVERRMARNRARYAMIKAGKVSKGDGKDVAHKDDNPHNNNLKNLAVQSKAKNRSYPRTKSGAMKK